MAKAVIGFDPGIGKSRKSGGVTILSKEWCASWPMPVTEIRGRRITDHSKLHTILVEITEKLEYVVKTTYRPPRENPNGFPAPSALSYQLPSYGEIKAFIEEIPRVPPKGKFKGDTFVRGGTQTLALGENWGCCTMACEMKNIPVEFVRPKEWQSIVPIEPMKNIMKRFPQINFTPKGCRKPNLGMVASAWIALFGAYRENILIA